MKRLAYAAAAIFLLAALLVLLAPALVDTPAVRAEIQRRLDEALHGQVTWAALDIALFPPHGELREVRIEIPGKLSAAAEEVDVYLRFWPLLLGRAEISSVTLQRPTIRITAAGGGREGPLDAMALYRAVAEPAASALKRFAPEMSLSLDRASVEAGDFALRDLRARAHTDSKGVALELAAASNLWKRLSADARVEYEDLSGRATIAFDDLASGRDVPPATLRARLRTDGKSALECDFEGSLGTLVPAAKGRLLLPAGKPPQLEAELTGVDAAQGIALARRKGAPLDVLESAEGEVSVKAAASLGPPWLVSLEIVKSDAAVKLAQLPWKLSAHAGRITLTQERIHIAGARGILGSSTFEDLAAQVDFGSNPILSSASGRATLPLEQWLPWLQGKLPLDEIASVSGGAEVTLHRLALRFSDPAAADYDALVVPRKARAVLKALPAPVSVDGGTIRVDSRKIALDNVAAAMLDARTRVSGNILLKGPGIELALADGTAGEKIVRWALERGKVPPHLEPKTPLRFAARRIAWAPKGGALEADARVEFENGPALGVVLAWRPDGVELRRATIKDARSDALFSATIAGDLIEAAFSGKLQGHSIPAMLRQSPLPADSGAVQGAMRVTIDRKQPQRSAAEGDLRVEALDLSWFARRKVIIERAELTSDAEGLRVHGARFSVEDQVFELSGRGRRTAQGPVVEARLESPGVVLERLLPPRDPAAPPPDDSKLWPLPLSGRIEVRAAFVQGPRHRVEPFDGILSLEPERARLEVKEARVCGVSFPLEFEARAEEASLTAHVSMRDEPLEAAIRCLTGDTIEITGNANLHAELKSKGRPADLVRNLTGTAQGEVRNGRVMRFALLGNILAVRNIASPGEMRKNGFPYRRMTARGRFERGEFLVEEAFFDSNAARLAANGRIDLLGADSRLTVLVAPLTSIERVVGAIPLLGDVFGGTMVALPLSVNGDIRDPSVVPLGPRAITDQLLGIFERALKLPGKLVVPPQEAKP